MLIGYVRVSKSDGSQTLAPQRDALLAAGVAPERIYQDLASGRHDARPGLLACLKALQPGNTLVLWKLDRLGRDLRHLVVTAEDLRVRGIGLKVLAGAGAQIDTTTANGRLAFGIFAAFAEFERELIAVAPRPIGPSASRSTATGMIELDTRITTVADVFDALTADRPYRAAVAVPQALDIMRSDAGKAFDPACRSLGTGARPHGNRTEPRGLNGVRAAPSKSRDHQEQPLDEKDLTTECVLRSAGSPFSMIAAGRLTRRPSDSAERHVPSPVHQLAQLGPR